MKKSIAKKVRIFMQSTGIDRCTKCGEYSGEKWKYKAILNFAYKLLREQSRGE